MAALLNGVLMANCLLDWAVAASPFLGGDLQQRTLLSSLPNENTLTARAFSGAFVLHGLVRFAAGWNPDNVTVRRLAVASYLLELAQSALETFVYQTNTVQQFAGTAVTCGWRTPIGGALALLVQLSIQRRRKPKSA